MSNLYQTKIIVTEEERELLRKRVGYMGVTRARYVKDKVMCALDLSSGFGLRDEKSCASARVRLCKRQKEIVSKLALKASITSDKAIDKMISSWEHIYTEMDRKAVRLLMFEIKKIEVNLRQIHSASENLGMIAQMKRVGRIIEKIKNINLKLRRVLNDY